MISCFSLYSGFFWDGSVATVVGLPKFALGTDSYTQVSNENQASQLVCHPYLRIVCSFHILLANVCDDNVPSGHWISHSFALVLLLLILVGSDFTGSPNISLPFIDSLVAICLVTVEIRYKLIDGGNFVVAAPRLAALLLLSSHDGTRCTAPFRSGNQGLVWNGLLRQAT